MTNLTELQRADEGIMPLNWRYPSRTVQAARDRNMSGWMADFLDTGFSDIHFFCTPDERSFRAAHRGDPAADLNNDCFLDDHFRALPAVDFSQVQYYNYLFDMDGNAYSGRFRGLMATNGLVLKSTLFVTWLSDRLVPWHHYVPIDVTLDDLYPVLEYFHGGPGEDAPGHAALAETIARAGSAWTRRTLRPVDMEVYAFRLLLEYARLLSDDRERMGFIGDLLDDARSAGRKTT